MISAKLTTPPLSVRQTDFISTRYRAFSAANLAIISEIWRSVQAPDNPFHLNGEPSRQTEFKSLSLLFIDAAFRTPGHPQDHPCIASSSFLITTAVSSAVRIAAMIVSSPAIQPTTSGKCIASIAAATAIAMPETVFTTSDR